jgi:uncharacterized protein (UPF0548 family)
MFLLKRPTDQQVREFIAKQKNARFSYTEIGASKDGAPTGYTVDHNRIQLGAGADTFAQAIKTIQSWRMFNLGWVQLYFNDAPIAVGTGVAVLAHHLGICSLNACRIVYVVEEDREVKKYGFAYGTLTDHVEQGEERFTVEWNQADNSVWYDLFAFSKPRHPLAKLGYPLSRTLQKRFARHSKQAMVRAVQEQRFD